MSENKQATIYDISQASNVSIATVSRVINNNSKVSEKTKEKVLKVMKELNYEPNAFARGLGTGSMKTIGILCADVADIYLANAVSFLERELRQEGFDSVLYCTGYDYESKKEGMRLMESRRVDAVIMVGSQYIENTNDKNKYILDTAKAIPVMLLNGYLKGNNVYCTLSNDYEAFYNATNALLESGCRKVMFLYREMSYSRDLKYKGYCNALKDNNLVINDAIIHKSTGKMQKIKLNLEETFGENPTFDAVIACDDELAIGALKYCTENGIDVPEQVSIVGCNNSVLSTCCEPELSSIDNKCELLCINTVTTLMRVFDMTNVSPKTVIDTTFVNRNTTKV